MPIAINGSGTITGISAGGLPASSITTASIADNSVTYAKIGTTEQGQLCKAWVNFNGTSTVAIRASYNVSSITDNGTGDYTVNFTSALTDANYAFTVDGYQTTTANTCNSQVTGQTVTTTALRVQTTNSSFVLVDSLGVSVCIFR